LVFLKLFSMIPDALIGGSFIVGLLLLLFYVRTTDQQSQ